MTPLDRLIAEARAELRAETPQQLHTQFAPKLPDADGRVTTDEGGLGPPFTAQFHRTLAPAPRQSDTAVRYSLSREIVDYCRINHREHTYADGGKPVCAQLVYLAVWTRDEFGDGLSVDRIAALSGRPRGQVTRLISEALEHAERWRKARWLADSPVTSSTAGEDIGTLLAREHDLDHEAEVWQGYRSLYPQLAAWDEELERRRGLHKKFCRVGCPLLAEAA